MIIGNRAKHPVVYIILKKKKKGAEGNNLWQNKMKG